LTFLLDCPVAVGLARTAKRQAHSQAGEPKEDRFEREKLEFHEKVRAGFLEMARVEPARFRIIDATRSAAVVSSEINGIIDQALN
jgi:dTMP kinase